MKISSGSSRAAVRAWTAQAAARARSVYDVDPRAGRLTAEYLSVLREVLAKHDPRSPTYSADMVEVFAAGAGALMRHLANDLQIEMLEAPYRNKPAKKTPRKTTSKTTRKGTTRGARR
jgi:hypothetical protein